MSLHTKRRGGRASRKEARKDMIADPFAAVRPGLTGGSYRPLEETEIERIFETSLGLLETLGMGSPIPAFIQIGKKAGCTLGEDGRLRFPRALVEETVKSKAARRFTLYGFDPKYDLDISAKRVHFGTGGAAVHMLDLDSMTFELSTLLDLYDLACLAHNLEHLHFFLRPIVARDMERARELDLNTAYAVMSGTSKPVASSFFDPAHVREVVEMADMMLGDRGPFSERPFLHAANTFVVPPLRFAEESCECLVAQVQCGMTVMLVSAGQAGATSPAALAGSLAQALAECLAGLTLVNLIRPGHPATLGMWPFVSDLRTGAMSGGSGEQALLTAASAQIVNWLGLPVATPAGMTDSKMPDNQAGYEKGVTVALTAAAGSNMIYESGSMLASILSSSKEAFVIDNDMLGMINRTVRGIEVTEDTLSFKEIET
ncbi:MAG: trimethylamine methyltransferase family protein, partial [Kiloniellales bacterium]|nr:trimethylamine methyltransferase family protein [Kiloniellales bacterium]